MSSAKNEVPVPSQEKPAIDTKNEKGIEGGDATIAESEVTVNKESQTTEKKSSLPKTEDTKPAKEVPLPGPTKLPSSASMNPSPATATDKATAASSTSKQDSSEVSTSNATTKPKKAIPTPAATPAVAEPGTSGSTAVAASKQNTSDSKPGSNATLPKKEKTETPIPKPAVTTSAAAVAPKQPPQHSLSHSKPHTQQSQQNQQQQYRYFVPGRQNQEEAVFKMVQNIFKLLENRGPLTMAQLEYNLPILILGTTPSSQTMGATSSKSNAAVSRDPSAGENNKDANNVAKKRNLDPKTPNHRTSLCEEKLIPGNMVPDIVELLVTLGLIQQQIVDDDSVTQQSQPRFTVHFGKPKQFLVTPTNILSEIAKAQTEIQLSRQRQEILKEALSLSDQQAAERIKHIVLQHPQVVDDPVYVTALRNLQVDGMLMAGAPGNTNAGGSKTSSSSTGKDGSGKSKSVTGASGKKVGGGKRRQSGVSNDGGGGGVSGVNATTAKRKRQRLRKEIPASGGDANSERKTVVPSGSNSARSNQTTGGTLRTDQPKKVAPVRAGAGSRPSLPTPSVSAVVSTSGAIQSNKNT